MNRHGIWAAIRPAGGHLARTVGIIAALVVGFAAVRVPGEAVQGTGLTAPTSQRVVRNGAVEALERGTHYSRVHYTWQQQDTNGVWRACSSQYTQLENGLNRVDANGQWVPVTNALTITTNGAEYAGAEFSLVFRATPEAADAMVLVLTDGTRMVSHVAGIAYFDKTSGDSVLLAHVLPVQGQLTSDQTVTYPSCFSDGVDADLVLQVGRSSLAQDVVLHTALAPPSAYGLSDDSEMELLTEWVEAPDPVSDAGNTNGPNAAQDLMDFGPLFKIGMGKAFDLSAGEDSGLSVQKYWQTFTDTNGVPRRFLVEALNYADAKPWLGALPQPAGGGAMLTPGRIMRHRASARPLPARPERYEQAKLRPGSLKGILARNDAGRKARPGFLWDYVSLLGSSLSSYTFAGDQTYYISGTVTVSSSMVCEAGVILKFAAPTGSTWSKIVLQDSSSVTATFPTGLYKKVIATASDDDSVGSTIAGSSGSPSGGYANPVLSFSADSAANGVSVNDFIVKYAQLGFDLSKNGSAGTGHGISHSQFISCTQAVKATSTTVKLRNVLVTGTTTAVGLSSGTIRAQHLSVDGASVFSTGSGTVYLTNSILNAVTTMTQSGSSIGASINTVTPASGAFYADGNHYLGYFGVSYPSSSYQATAPTGNIDSALLADLRLRTTVAPATGLNTDLTFPSEAARDTGTSLDLGYHYDPIDLLAATIGIASGTTYAMPASYAVGASGPAAFEMDGGTLTAGGGPISRCWVIRSELVQDYLANPVDSSGQPFALFVKASNDNDTYGISDWLQLRFCSFAVPAGGILFNSGRFTTLIRLDDCEDFGGQLTDNVGLGNHGTLTARTNFLRNNLFVRATVNFDNLATNVAPVTGMNNTFSRCNVTLNPSSGNLWIWRNNLFDRTMITQNGVAVADGWNGYVTNGTAIKVFPSSGSDVVVTSSPFQSSTLGDFYLNQSSTLVNAGSSPADAAGYFFYTTATSQTLEGQTRLDMGYHYVGLLSGVPVNSNGGPGYLNDPTGFYYLNSQAAGAGTGATQAFSVFITHPVNGQNRP